MSGDLRERLEEGNKGDADNFRCPGCGLAGEPVPELTVRSLVGTNVPGGTYHLCLTPDCQIVYYGSAVFYRNGVREPVAWKEGAEPKFICYCGRVTETEIVAAIRNGARTIGEVARQTGAMRGGRCEETNPRGRCCADDIEAIIIREKKNR
jgi:bacterioferritin-associated ferredoxin